MASFCSNCGAPATGRFCGSCGAAVAAVAPAPPAATVPPPRPAGRGKALKILLVLFAVFVLFGMAVIGGVVYLGYRAKEKVAELQQEYEAAVEAANDSAVATESFPASQGSGCPLLEGDEAAVILAAAVDRVELNPNGPDGSEECQYWVSQAERQRLQRETIASGFAGLKDVDPTSGAEVEKLLGGILGAAIEAAGDNSNADFAFSLQLWRSGGQAMWDKMEANKTEVKNVTGIDFAGMATEPVEGVGDRATLLPTGQSIMVLKGDAFFVIAFQQFVPGREKTIALAQAVAGRV